MVGTFFHMQAYAIATNWRFSDNRGRPWLVCAHGFIVSFLMCPPLKAFTNAHPHPPPPHTHTHLYFRGQVLFLYCSSILGRNNSQIDCWTFEGYCNGFRRPMFLLYFLCALSTNVLRHTDNTHIHTDMYLLPQQLLLEMPWPTPGCLELGSVWAKTCSGSLLWSAHGHSWSCSHTSLWTGRRNDEYNEVAPNHLNYQLYQSTV